VRDRRGRRHGRHRREGAQPRRRGRHCQTGAGQLARSFPRWSRASRYPGTKDPAPACHRTPRPGGRRTPALGVLSEGGRGLFLDPIAPRPRPTSPRCFGVVNNDVWLEEVSGPAPAVEDTAWHLAHWQVGHAAQLDRPRMACDQLGRCSEVSHLDWGFGRCRPKGRTALGGPVPDITRLSLIYRWCVRTVITASATSSAKRPTSLPLIGPPSVGTLGLFAPPGPQPGPEREVGVSGLNLPMGERYPHYGLCRCGCRHRLWPSALVAEHWRRDP
jgi:hypothetical protein